MAKRDKNGKFLPGTTGNPKGRPKGKRADYLALLRSCTTPERWKKIVDRALADAAKGNAPARKWISDYLLGRPVERVLAEVLGVPMTVDEWREKARARREEVEKC